MRHSLILLALMVLAAPLGAAPAWAENRAVVIGNADYGTAPDLAGSDTAALAAVMRQAGFVTAEGIDQTASDLRQTLELIARADPQPGARIVALSGRFLNGAAETWFMGAETDRPDPLTAGAQGVPLSLVMQLMAGAREGAVLLLGTDQQETPHQSGLASGIGELAPVAGVTVISGSPEAMARALRELAAGRSVGQALSAGLKAHLLPGGRRDLTPARRKLASAPSPDPVEADRLAWADALKTDSAQGYDAYLRRYPAGIYAAAAAERRRHLLNSADAQAAAASPERIEAELGLDQARRAAIQRGLSRLGYAAGTVDGRLGARSRMALRAWQHANGLPQTGYLTRTQHQMLNRQVSQLDRADRDRTFWRQTGAQGGVPDLRAYLTRYPNGQFSAEARRRLDAQELPPQDETATWLWAQRQASAGGYDTYLDRFPRGPHAAEARARRDSLTASTEMARRAEVALGLDLATCRLIENRLQRAGMRPGRIDGEFTAETRQALRRYQASRNLRVTGYVSQQTIANLLSEALQ